MLRSQIHGLEPTSGRIGPWGWVAKMGVLHEILGKMGQIPETSENPYVKSSENPYVPTS
jgi:hypothetical protein